jgi:hypothetical protein
MKVFITKYALSTGIIEKDADPCKTCPDMIEVRDSFHWYAHKGEWFLTREDAIKDANSRRAKKITSVKKQLAKLESMTF